MTEFVGRTGSNRVYSYPETPRAAAAALVAFARNFATGTKGGEAVAPGPDGSPIAWNAIDVVPTTPFTIPANGTLVSIAGDVTALFTNGEDVILTPTAPVAGPGVDRTIVSPPTFAAGFTTFNIDSSIDVSTTAGTIRNAVNIPITPKSSGVVLVSGTTTLQNGPGVPITATVQVAIDGVVTVPFSSVVVPADTNVAVPFIAEFVGLTVGVTRQISVIVTGGGLSILEDASGVNVQEVPASTG